MFVVKKNSEMVNKTFRLPVELVEQLTEVARMQDMSVNMRWAIWAVWRICGRGSKRKKSCGQQKRHRFR